MGLLMHSMTDINASVERKWGDTQFLRGFYVYNVGCTVIWELWCVHPSLQLHSMRSAWDSSASVERKLVG